jgi:hypothetical protein
MCSHEVKMGTLKESSKFGKVLMSFNGDQNVFEV